MTMHQMNSSPRTSNRNHTMKDLQTLFKDPYDISAPAALADRVLLAVRETARKEDRRDRIAWGSFFLASLAFFGTSVVYAVQEFSNSSFGNYFSLIFSDLGSIVHLWRELGLSLLESLPLTGVLFVLGSTVLVLFTIRKYSRPKDAFISNTYPRTA